MSQKQADLRQLRDMIERLVLCQQQLTFSEEGDAVRYLAEVMLKDLDQCGRLCRNLRRSADAVLTCPAA